MPRYRRAHPAKTEKPTAMAKLSPAGFRRIEITDPVQHARIDVALFYPAEDRTAPTPYGPYVIEVASDAPIAANGCPLVVVSHGNGGFPEAHRDLGLHLARNGMMAALVRHPGNTTGDNGLAGTIDCLENRPRHLDLVLNALLADTDIGAHADREKIALAGHSLGAYTALALAGGVPVTSERETGDASPAAVQVPHRDDIRALILMAPATFWYRESEALKAIKAPVFMRTGEKDTITPQWHADIIRHGLRPEIPMNDAIVPGAGHFSFMSPFPPERTSPGLPPSQDPLGFDRRAFLRSLNDEIVDNLRNIFDRPASADSL